MTKKRILLIQNNLTYGGTSTLILFIAKHLSDKYVFDLFCFEDNVPDKEKEFLSYGGEILKSSKINYNKRGLSGRLLSYWQRFFGRITNHFNKKLKSKEYFAVHCFEDLLSGYYLKACKKAGIKKRIVHFNIDHSVIRATNPLNWILLKKELHLIKKYTTIFAAGSTQAMPKLFTKRNDAIIINNPIDSKFIFNDFIPKNLRLLQMGTFNDNKNQLFSISVLKILVSKFKLGDAKLVLAGQQPKEESNYLKLIRKAINECGLSENVEILGATNNPEVLYAENSALIFPSKKEAFGLVLIEAQSCGMQCFSSTAAANETNFGGVFFLKLEDGPEAWAEEIFKYYKSVNYSKKHFDTSKYSSEKIREVYIDIYEK